MDTDKIRWTVQALFESPIRYEVPSFYQRPYVWTRENQWEDLWEDIKRKAEETLDASAGSEFAEDDDGDERSDAIANHFFGAFVVRPYTHRGLGPQRKDVIDGQQRLTTLQVLLRAFEHAVCDTVGSDHEVAKATRLLVENPNRESSDDTRFKVWPTETDRSEFRSVMAAASRAESCKSEQGAGRGRPLENRSTGIRTAYLFFDEFIREFLLGGRQEPGNGAQDVDRRTKALFEVIAQRMDLVMIELHGADDPQVIFEALNGRGTPLLPSDLIKNYVFERSRRSAGVKDPARLYSLYWADFDTASDEGSEADESPDRFWKVEVKQGRLTRPRIDLFLFHYLKHQEGKDIRITELYREFKKWWGGR